LTATIDNKQTSIPLMQTEFYTFGEILWDCLPSGRHAGGAPFNVAAHLVQLGTSATLISSIGKDPLGEEILQVANDKRVNTEFVSVHPKLPTGTVMVTINEKGNASYEIVEPVAWDEIEVPPEAVEAVANARGFVFGSLSCRSGKNIKSLDSLLELDGPLKFFDVNLRPPYADPECVVKLAARADVIKLNHEEVGKLAAFIQTGDTACDEPLDTDSVARAAAVLAEKTETPVICVTRAENGAALWDRGTLVTTPAPYVRVKDTVGAGDSFMAGLMVGLTNKIDARAVVGNACRVGAFVASHHGATPLLPADIKDAFAYA
jgi:fructokinase